MTDIVTSELLGEHSNGMKCCVRGRLVWSASSDCGLLLDVHDIRYAAWSEIRLMNVALSIHDPEIPCIPA